MQGFFFSSPLVKNEKMESSQDARSEQDSFQSIISEIADGAENVPEAGLAESEFQMVATEHGSFKRKPEQSEEGRKMSKSDLEPDDKFITGEIKPEIDDMTVQMFTDLPEESAFQLTADQVLDHDEGQSVYQPLSMQESPSSAVQALQGSIDTMQVAVDAANPAAMPQLALGLIPAKDITPLQPAPPEEITVQFQNKLDELEKQVKFLQNRNQALEESYKKLSDLVEAQNHLLASGGPFIQRVVTATTREDPKETTKADCDSALGEAAGTLSSATALPPSLQSTPRLGLGSYELPRRVSAKEILSLWEHGSDDFPPLKDWTPTQKLKQQSKISRWKKLVDIFKNDYHGDMNEFEESFSDAKGEILPVTTILSLYETQQTPAFLGKSRAEAEDNPLWTSEACRDGVDDTKKAVLKPSDSEADEMEDNDGHAEIKVEKIGLHSTETTLTQTSTEVHYPLPRKVTPNDIVRLWEEGCDEFPPVCQWSRAQKIGQETKIFRWRKISEIFNKDCNRNWETFHKKYTNDRGQLLAISSIIAKYDAENATSGPIFDRPEAQYRSGTASDSQEEGFVGGKPTSVAGVNGVEVKVESAGSSDGSTHILPRKVTAKDIIRLWETGYGDLPPLSQWTPAQKAGQRSKFSRWTKIYDIYKYHCKGDLSLFESKFSDERGELYPVTTIVAMFDAWESPSSLTSHFTGSQLAPKSGDGSEAEIYQLPRKVTAKDVVQLWEEGCELFPPVSKWPKVHKVGHETKLFRWKKIVDIFRKDCDGSWEKFGERFSGSKGELLPISAILSKYDLENEPTSYLPKSFTSSLNRPTGSQKTETSEPVEDKETCSDSDTADDETSSLRKGAEFILPKKVTALDVIYLWENGLGDMPPLCQWTPAQKASQRSKISRWNKVVDIFKYECGSDIRKFEEKYRDEKGDLLPITNILSLHDAQDKTLWSH